MLLKVVQVMGYFANRETDLTNSYCDIYTNQNFMRSVSVLSMTALRVALNSSSGS